ncbi:MAG TPA: sugar ABC transporter ATP-binding protein [Verrucomicrobiae bacterium]|jgi:ribose transport system ATP-binding protein|nr:sugar ABC transporter ATP-binding protein [Verrucomicrobiae bacterium]
MNPAPPDVQASKPPLARLSGITKRFGRVTVLRDVSIQINAGEVHVLAGENGAGKSTLIKILAGVHPDYEGAIEINGVPVHPHSPAEAGRLGVAVIHQELSLIGPMSVADNIFLGRNPVAAGFVRAAVQREEARRWIQQLGLDIDVGEAVESFPVAVQQLVEIAKALSRDARILVMDEPTSALNMPEVETLFRLIQTLKQRGIGIVYISHKMEEIERIADRITVLRDGSCVGTAPAGELPPARLIQWMVGRELGEVIEQKAKAAPSGQPVLRLRDFTVPAPGGVPGKPAVDGVSLEVHAGEILGVAGLQGSGATELFWGMFGAYGSSTRGDCSFEGKPARFKSPRQAIDAGLALLTNDRKASGLVLTLSVIANATLAGLRELSPYGWRSPARERAAAQQTTGSLHLVAASLDGEVGWLSGGNQQKVALAKCLQTRPRLLLLDEPTRGIDIGAKREIYRLMEEWKASGMALLLITSEMPELLALSDRIVVLHRGRVTGEFARSEATAEKILTAAMGREHTSTKTNSP